MTKPALNNYSDGLREAERWDLLVGINRTRVDCTHLDHKGYLCNHPENRLVLWVFKWFRRPCRIIPGREATCKFFKKCPSHKTTFADPSIHGQCIDMAGNEWEVVAVTGDDVVISVRGPDGRSCQTRIPKEPFLNRLADSPAVEAKD